MTYRSREDYLAPSEESSPYFQSGSVLFAQPSAVDHWCRSITYAEGYPLSPRDTASDCAPSDCPDMQGQTWSQASLPDDAWTAAAAPEHSTVVQGPDSEWPSHNSTLRPQDLQSFDDSSAWLNVSHGPVNMGPSPALSHESQSSHTLQSVSEPDFPLLPPGLDLSFIGEPHWESSGHVAYPPSAPEDYPATVVLSPESVSAPPHMVPYYPSQAATHSFACGKQYPSVPTQGGYPAYPRPAISNRSASPHGAQVPRCNGQPEPHVQTFGPPVPLHLAASYAVHSVAAPSVSHGYSPPIYGPFAVAGGHGRASPHGQGLLTPQPDTAAPYACASRSQVLDPGHEEPSNPAQECQSGAISLSYPTVRAHRPDKAPTSISNGLKPALSRTDSDDSACYPATSNTGSLAGEGDEGRYRNHPLYAKGPEADGLYHCPFKSDPTCQHKATKLKCNYDKFIDSHLKPFRCKIEACSKQEFSSTACLLRHEREAHGMHGHGDRPHLCFYPGCERGIPGNGFPRRYNLFDHMKRVHDHKAEPGQDTADTKGSRKVAGRKRKASGSVNEEPAPQRQKTQGLPSPVPSVGQMPYQRPVMTYPEAPQGAHLEYDTFHANRQRHVYSQWNQQRQLLEYQMSSVTGPDDEASLQLLSQNVEEFRRLSQEARQG